MRPIFVRTLTTAEQEALRAGLRSSEAFTVRRCQILLTGAAERLKPREIAARLHCSDQCVRDAINAFQRNGLACLQAKSHAPHHPQEAFDAAGRARLQELVHSSPRSFGQESSVWTLSRLAQVCLAEGLTAELVSDAAIRQALRKLDINWKRAKKRIQSPDQQYGVKKNGATG